MAPAGQPRGIWEESYALYPPGVFSCEACRLLPPLDSENYRPDHPTFSPWIPHGACQVVPKSPVILIRPFAASPLKHIGREST